MVRRNASISAFRALGALFLQGLLKPVGILAAILLLAGYSLMVFLVLSFSNWWLLLMFILIPITIMLLAAVVAVRYILGKLLPAHLSKTDKQKIAGFIEKAVGVAEKARLPYPVLLFLVAKDVVRGKESKFLRTLVGDSKELLKDFGEIQRLFS